LTSWERRWNGLAGEICILPLPLSPRRPFRTVGGAVRPEITTSVPKLLDSDGDSLFGGYGGYGCDGGGGGVVSTEEGENDFVCVQRRQKEARMQSVLFLKTGWGMQEERKRDDRHRTHVVCEREGVEEEGEQNYPRKVLSS